MLPNDIPKKIFSPKNLITHYLTVMYLIVI